MVGLVVMGQTKAAPKAEARPYPLVSDLAKAIIPTGWIVRLMIMAFHISMGTKNKEKKGISHFYGHQKYGIIAFHISMGTKN